MTETGEITEQELETGRKLFLKPCEFIAASTAISNLPPMDGPEVAFAGRSNVGKSSLVNALTQRRTLARTSQTPGRTKQLNFFNLDGRIRLVDLPGYGYAKASKTDVRAWTSLTLSFLKGRQTLMRVFLLIDSRRGIGDADREIMKIFNEAAVSWALVLTKGDKLKPPGLEKVASECRREVATHVASWPGIFVTSSQKTTGIDTLRAHIAGLARP
ncbi:MAG: YihA family ribosome biogenesis GTP-binding protein [SAR116 cluster bacterium MED-G04]|jgi:GTP-binding protein|nr:MAG: YihA family ribosome biogenesis GTP-binding protein [SAR116 cluster bacterium MED-G04]CAI8393100.1 MAG: putative GTP-binding protein EngB [SAR116 cluster bacterium MED-G04]HCD49829.1 YihA family ribosome biogenesis GTP-binding protein [Alphaproteobacteria bacterium]HCV62491.1 YihA family ribosome biogenesis GTP-binding protein [Alphaproteobacteria bacterium]|tara:strand:- start:7827 stop:8471 length:645 start_codon:yes stop_codon:yes gene_type:complete